MIRKLVLILAASASLMFGAPTVHHHPKSLPVVHAELTAFVVHHRTYEPARDRAMDWAIRQAGCWYAWGGTGCNPGFDCSGLVMMSYASIGIHLPRTTYDMLADVGHRHYLRHIWWVLVQISRPGRGDLTFYGSGHVELKSRFRHGTFGAHDSGTRVGWVRWSRWWHPTAFYRVEVHRR